MNILIINGPNLNMLGSREEIYGDFTYKQMCENIQSQFDFKIDFFQSNFEGEIIEIIHKSIDKYECIVINPAAFTHYSYAIRDALDIFKGVKIEVHLTNINNREEFRKVNVIKEICDKSFIGFGIDGYVKAIEYALKKTTD